MSKFKESYLDLKNFYQENFLSKGLITLEQAEAEIYLILEDLFQIKERPELLKIIQDLRSFSVRKNQEQEISEKLETIKLIRQRRIPIQYILGRAYFFELEFKVNPNVLIPRPETELLVEKSLEEIKKISSNKQIKILEIGTGSGCISIALAQSLIYKENLSSFKIKATDLSEEALKIAKINLDRYKLEEFIELEKADLVSQEDQKANWDLIVSNPPYIKKDEYQDLSLEVKQEPKLALIEEDFYQRFKALNLGYQVAILELNQNLAQETGQIFEKSKLLKDYSGNFRFLIVQNKKLV